MCSVTSTRDRPSFASGRISNPETRADAMIPPRPRPHQREGLRQIVAAGPHRGAAPEVEHDAARPGAVILGIAGDQVLRHAAADLPGGPGRHGARIDGEQVAAGRQHVGAPLRRRAGGPGRHETPIEGAQRGLWRSDGPQAARTPSAPDGDCPNTCRPSPIRASLRSHSQLSSVASASSVSRGSRADRQEAALCGPVEDGAAAAGARGGHPASAPRHIRRTSARVRRSRRAPRRRPAAA